MGMGLGGIGRLGRLGIPAPGKGVGVVTALDRLLGAGGADYAFFDSSVLSTMFQDSAGATPVTAVTDPVGRWNVVKKAPRSALNATDTQRGVLQSGGVKFDGSDDRLLTDWLWIAGSNCMIVQAAIPATVSAFQGILSANDASANRAFLGVETDGQIAAGLGTVSTGTIKGGGDKRGTTVTACLTWNGTNVRLHVAAATVYAQPQSGGPTTTVAVPIGCLRTNGGFFNFFAGNIKRAALGRKFLTLQEYQEIVAEWP